MTLQLYATDLSDAEWEILAPLLEPRTRRARPRTHDVRTMLNAVLYVLRGGVSWRLLPHDDPPWHSVHDQFWRWRCSAIWQAITDAWRERARALMGQMGAPRIAIIDSQTAWTSEAGGERGYDGGTRLCGRKRHLVVDSQGLVLQVCVELGCRAQLCLARPHSSPSRGLGAALAHGRDLDRSRDEPPHGKKNSKHKNIEYPDAL